MAVIEGRPGRHRGLSAQLGRVILLTMPLACSVGAPIFPVRGAEPAASRQPRPEPPARTPRVHPIPLPYLRGLAPLPGGDWLLAGPGRNELYRLPPLLQEGGKPQALPVPPGLLEVEALEEVCSDGAGKLYLLAAHGRNRFGDTPEPRMRLGYLQFHSGGQLLRGGHSGALLEGIVNEVPFLADSLRRTPARAGLKLEGLACPAPGVFLVGVRSPTVTESVPRPHGGQEDAVLLHVPIARDLFTRAGARVEIERVEKLDLGGQGIRALVADPIRRGLWLVSGLSVEPNHGVQSSWGLWFRPHGGAPRPVPLPTPNPLREPTGIALAGAGGLYLLEGDAQGSRILYLQPLLEEKPGGGANMGAKGE